MLVNNFVINYIEYTEQKNYLAKKKKGKFVNDVTTAFFKITFS